MRGEDFKQWYKRGMEEERKRGRVKKKRKMDLIGRKK